MDLKFTDSLEDSRHELDLLRDELKQKNQQLEEKSKIISSLRQQVEDLQNEANELEANEQLMRQKMDRLRKESQEKDETIEAVSHAKNEIENAYGMMNQKMEARVKQVQKLLEESSNLKKELKKFQELSDESVSQRDQLKIELDSMKRALRDRERDNDEIQSQNNTDLYTQIAQLKQQNTTLSNEINKYQQHLKHLQEQHDNRKFLKEIEELKGVINELKSAPKQQHSRESGDHSREHQTHEEMVQELYDLRAKVKSLSHRQSRRSIDEEITKLKQELEVTETSWKLERHHKERYAKENLQLEKRISDLNKKYEQLEAKLASMTVPVPNETNTLYHQQQQHQLQASQSYQQLPPARHQAMRPSSPPPPPLPPKSVAPHQQAQVETRSDATAAIHFSVADEMGEFMEKSSSILARKENYTPNYRIKKSQFFQDPIDEQKMRLQRVNELARRNLQTKPLHQTSYPLELDTFDVPNLTETQIKRGQLPLADSSNQRRPVKKAEAFMIV